MSEPAEAGEPDDPKWLHDWLDALGVQKDDRDIYGRAVPLSISRRCAQVAMELAALRAKVEIYETEKFQRPRLDDHSKPTY